MYTKSWEPPTVLPATHTDFKETENPDGAAEGPHRSGFSLRWEYVATVLVILLIAGIRFRLRDFPLERDEGGYAYALQLILEGIPPYELAYNMKLPGTYAAYAAVMAVFAANGGRNSLWNHHRKCRQHFSGVCESPKNCLTRPRRWPPERSSMTLATGFFSVHEMS